MSAEVNSNLARFDGIRYGYRAESYESTDDLFIRTRSEGSGEECETENCTRRPYLSENTGQKLYKKAMQVRLAIKNELEAALEGYDAILTPTTVEKPPHFGTTTKHALKMYSSDIFNTPVNLGGFCAFESPLGGLAESLQLIGRRGDDAHVLAVGSALKRVLQWLSHSSVWKFTRNSRRRRRCSARARMNSAQRPIRIFVRFASVIPAHSRLNKDAVRRAILAGFVMDCQIRRNFQMDRKKYFYPDLTKGFQIFAE